MVEYRHRMVWDCMTFHIPNTGMLLMFGSSFPVIMDDHSYWVLSLTLIGVVALYLMFRFRGQRWPRVMAVTAAGAMLSMFVGDGSATSPILLTGLILTIGSASSARK